MRTGSQMRPPRLASGERSSKPAKHSHRYAPFRLKQLALREQLFRRTFRQKSSANEFGDGVHRSTLHTTRPITSVGRPSECRAKQDDMDEPNAGCRCSPLPWRTCSPVASFTLMPQFVGVRVVGRARGRAVDCRPLGGVGRGRGRVGRRTALTRTGSRDGLGEAVDRGRPGSRVRSADDLGRGVVVSGRRALDGRSRLGERVVG